MEENSNTAILEKLSSIQQYLYERQELMHSSMEACLENMFNGLVEKLATTMTNSQFPPKLPPHGSQQRPPPPPPPTYGSGYFPPPGTIKLPKLHLQPFDGTEPQDWVFQAEQYFNLYQVAPFQRVQLVVFSMKGNALSWYKWMFNTNQLTSWEEFTKALLIRFGPSSFLNPQAELFKLKQTSTVMEYQSRFERLSNQVVGLTPEMILNCFLSGLNPEIAIELAILQPFSVTHALRLAKLVESKIAASKAATWRLTRINAPVPHNQSLGCGTSGAHATNYAALPIKRLTAVQVQERIAQGLCYNCDEVYITGHRCEPKQFLLLLVDDPNDTFQHPEPTRTIEDTDWVPSHTDHSEVREIPNDVLKIKRDLDVELFGEGQSWGCSVNNVRDSLHEGHEQVRYTRDQLLQLREVTQVREILNDVLKIKRDLDAELFGEDQSWGRSENNAGDSLYERHERVQFTRHHLLRLREVTQVRFPMMF
ncbi:PREDICTED: uncharacterized protein LOC109346555 [Lupinus angustifolius]|uniref:uncharacterized protein LOC109346555 n=1 Tax=Lupinus angustifolius TaxID=3871 RepID=UPI00092E7E54|nr:PREDICTED: uncharacterized protein LOC109346555 [Lupinus angustifolius]